jgi:hypothetical protein
MPDFASLWKMLCDICMKCEDREHISRSDLVGQLARQQALGNSKCCLRACMSPRVRSKIAAPAQPRDSSILDSLMLPGSCKALRDAADLGHVDAAQPPASLSRSKKQTLTRRFSSANTLRTSHTAAAGSIDRGACGSLLNTVLQHTCC